MTFFLLKDLNPETSSINVVIEAESGQKAIKSGFGMVLLDVLHCWSAVQMVKEEEAHLSWPDIPLHVHHIMGLDGSLSSHFKPLTPGKLWIRLVQSISGTHYFFIIMEPLLTYAGAFFILILLVPSLETLSGTWGKRATSLQALMPPVLFIQFAHLFINTTDVRCWFYSKGLSRSMEPRKTGQISSVLKGSIRF